MDERDHGSMENVPTETMEGREERKNRRRKTMRERKSVTKQCHAYQTTHAKNRDHCPSLTTRTTHYRSCEKRDLRCTWVGFIGWRSHLVCIIQPNLLPVKDMSFETVLVCTQIIHAPTLYNRKRGSHYRKMLPTLAFFDQLKSSCFSSIHASIEGTCHASIWSIALWVVHTRQKVFAKWRPWE